ncbi:hypothetical protein GUJ93_ZPchr0013g36114 [Zizania palustris]|uniref:Uncharacterized protein n=1 Tax=Zizania palustris TaxID=103762 RepID=A0A8J5WWY9_ZIZPA|nr:hypothetical protein GUJ93_ZPchr0013g36114 [Zizania palustris]
MAGVGRRGAAAAAAACRRWCLVIPAVASALGVSGPAFYWRYKKGFASSSSSSSAAAVSSSCPPCSCDCPPPLSLQSIAPGKPSNPVPLVGSCNFRSGVATILRVICSMKIRTSGSNLQRQLVLHQIDAIAFCESLQLPVLYH